MNTLPRFSIRPTYPTNSLREEDLQSIQCPEELFRFYQRTLKSDPTFEPDKEQVWVIVVDCRFKLIGYHVVSVGSVQESLAPPLEVFRPVIVAGQRYFYLVHNHPSGGPAPSDADHRITRRIEDGAEILDLKFIDHVILGKAEYYSFREHGHIN